jgi:hypothetical protein
MKLLRRRVESAHLLGRKQSVLAVQEQHDEHLVFEIGKAKPQIVPHSGWTGQGNVGSAKSGFEKLERAVDDLIIADHEAEPLVGIAFGQVVEGRRL